MRQDPATTAVVPARIWTTTWPASAGATLVVDAGRAVLMDHGMTSEAAEELVTLVNACRPALYLARLVWTHWDNGLAVRAPEHTPQTYPGQIPVGCSQEVEEVAGLRVHRVGHHQVVGHDGATGTVIAGDLFAPGIPELSALTLAQAREAYAWIRSVNPTTIIGSRGAVSSTPEQIRRALHSRMAYLEHLEQIGREGARQGLIPRQIWDLKPWTAWPGDAARHMINTHASIAHISGRPLSLAHARADLAEVAPEYADAAIAA